MPSAGSCDREVVTVLGDEPRVSRTVVDAIRQASSSCRTPGSSIVRRRGRDEALVPRQPANSNTNALVAVRRSALRTVPRDRRTLVMLGEVDCGFLIWHRAETKGASVERHARASPCSATRTSCPTSLASGRRGSVSPSCRRCCPRSTTDDHLGGAARTSGGR